MGNIVNYYGYSTILYVYVWSIIIIIVYLRGERYIYMHCRLYQTAKMLYGAFYVMYIYEGTENS